MDPSLLFPLLILLLIPVLFLSGRRQRRQVREMQALQAALEPGDVVITTSGLRATVVDAAYEETVDLEIAEGVVTTWVRAAVREKVVDPASPDEVTGDADHHEVTGDADHHADQPADHSANHDGAVDTPAGEEHPHGTSGSRN